MGARNILDEDHRAELPLYFITVKLSNWSSTKVFYPIFYIPDKEHRFLSVSPFGAMYLLDFRYSSKTGTDSIFCLLHCFIPIAQATGDAMYLF